ncbi:hypothetical protein ACS0TY_001111 [Phlomoides rotata]
MRREFERVLGDGTETKFWDVRWGEGVCLRERFGRLFRVSEQQEALVSEVGNWENGMSKPRAGGADRWVWNHHHSGRYLVNKAYDKLLERNSTDCADRPDGKMFKKLWRSWATRKAITTSWKVLKQKMATTDNLIRRGVHINDEDKTCQLCKEKEENIRHLFFECKVSYIIWSNIINWLGIDLVLHINPSTHFLTFAECLGRGERIKVATTLWTGIVWSIWNLRNEVIFKKVAINVDKEICKI